MVIIFSELLNVGDEVFLSSSENEVKESLKTINISWDDTKRCMLGKEWKVHSIVDDNTIALQSPNESQEIWNFNRSVVHRSGELIINSNDNMKLMYK